MEQNPACARAQDGHGLSAGDMIDQNPVLVRASDAHELADGDIPNVMDPSLVCTGWAS